MPEDAEALPRRRSWWPLCVGAGLALVLVAGVLLWVMLPASGARTRLSSGGAPAADQGDPASWEKWAAASTEAIQARLVGLVLFDPDSGVWETRRVSIELPDHEAGRLKEVVGAWLAEATGDRYGPFVPSRSALIDGFVDGNHRAYLSFSPDFAQPDGITAELERIVGLAKTLQANFPTVTELQILVDGEPVETLSGQLDVSAPLRIAYFADMDV